MRSNVKKCLPVLRRQIHDLGYDSVKEALVKGKTKFMSRKDRFEAMTILDLEFEAPEVTLENITHLINSGKI